jgi:hypothetical protein
MASNTPPGVFPYGASNMLMVVPLPGWLLMFN